MPRFVPRERKHKKIARVHKASNTSTTNAEQIIPESQTEREARRDAIKAELRAAQPESKGSSKKRKRMDKYIDIKLKKDENAELLKKLEGHRVDTSLLQSSKKLGRTRDTQREKLARAINERNAGIGSNEDFLFEERAEVDSVDDGASEGSQDEISPSATTPAVQSNGMTPNFGGGLKRPLELDESGRPVIQKRKRRKRNVPRTLGVGQEEDVELEDALYANGHLTDESADEHIEEEEWAGFSPAPSEEDDDYVSDISATSDDLEQDSASTASSQSFSVMTSPDEKPARLSAFKAWADTQRNTALDFTPSANPTSASDSHTGMATAKANFKPRQLSPDSQISIIPALPQPDRATSKPAYAITIPRSEEVQAARLELPVAQEEQKIMEAINANPVVVVCGATGSGKTTQVPQMLLENGYASSIPNAKSTTVQQDTPPQSRGMIGVTQPRRVAATSVATRVSYELGVEYRKCVAHQVRYDTNVGKDTAVKFMTDGILLREIQQDFILSKYSVIVLDEAHERSVNTDLLIGLLSRIVALRADLAAESPDKHYPLKLIIMSATLSHGVDSFLQNTCLWNKLGGPPQIVEAEGRQFPVTVHFARKTRRDYVSEIVDKVARGHRKLPPGGMLVFMTGQQEISDVARRLRGRIGGSTLAPRGRDADADDYEEGLGVVGEANDYLEGEEDASDSDSDAEIRLCEEDEKDAEFDVEDLEPDRHTSTSSARAPLKPHILPLYAALPNAQQLKVFQPPPSESHRPIILATNVAETSLTIPGIRYVFDSGRVKEKRYNTSTGVQTFEVDWISKASAEQRKGRAGRTGPGHVWRLYSSAVYEEFFAEETVPEILRTPLESTVLQLKAMDIENVVHFPFPTAPEPGMLEQAELLLRNLGAIEVSNGGVVSKTGKEIMRFPVSPRFGKMLMLARNNLVVAHAVALVAALAVGDLTVPEAQSDLTELEDEGYQDEEDSDSNDRARRHAENIMKVATVKRHQDYTRAQAKLAGWDDRSDAVKLLTAVAGHAETSSGDSASQFCKSYWLREKGMEEVQLLRKQLHNIVLSQESSSNVGMSFSQKLPLPTEQERTKLNQIVAAGFIDQVAIRADMLKDGVVRFGQKPKRAIEVPYRTLFSTMGADPNNSTMSPEEAELHRSVFVHPSSVLARLSVKEMPQYVVYSHLSRAAPSAIDDSKQRTKKTRIHALTAIGPKALATLAEGTPLLQIGKPVGKIEELPRGGDGKQRRQCWVNISLQAAVNKGHDGVEWPLGAWKVVQKRGTRDWVVEEVVAR
ncbi:putative ATP-dependent RNA helicase DHR1 [Vermiconidia calcicola]|uniref:ATP-dependent RNA helicase DHR1 n=1 Tax=Vermiconidia calcicola TaxID=1690605 RepID=A0ACC3MI40_9PEZI|nr:putative ATP-dependent RNA helicase DHR1 [Vermiconidia calcicola]